MRDALGLADGGDVEIQLVDGCVTITPPIVAKRVEYRDGRAVIVADDELPPLTDEIVRATLQEIRR
jgi:hypothetical protein